MSFLEKIVAILIGISILVSLSDPLYAKHRAHKKIAKASSTASNPIVGSTQLVTYINNAIQNVDPNLNIGIAIKSMKNGEVLYTHNEYRTFIPASILKIFTAEAALLYLGSDFTFQTKLFTDATTVDKGVLKGNLYLVHSGDPTLTYYDLIDLMDTLKSHQIEQVDGNVYIDTTAYDQTVYGPGWIWDDTQYCYGAPISASIINHNCLSFSVAPSKTVGTPANIVENSHLFYNILNSVVTKSARSRSCSLHLGTNSDSSISVSGCMPKGHYAQGLTAIVRDVVEYNKSLLRTLFRRSGVQINGSVLSGAAPSNLSLLVTHESKPLNKLISDMLKKSDNVIAGSLFKKIGEIYSKQPGTWENGSYAVKQILAVKAGVNTSNMNVLDGSGLSRENQITPSQMLQVLTFAFHNTATNYDLISSLPVAGIDGTLKRRLYNIAWKVRAKTGTMSKSGVNALAGYTLTRDREPLAFVIIVNGHLGMGWKYKELEDRIVTAMTKYTRVG